MDAFANTSPLKISSFNTLDVLLFIVHEKPFPLMNFFFTFFTSNHHQHPLQAQNQSIFQSLIYPLIPPTALRFFDCLPTPNYPTPQLHLQVTNLIYKTKTAPVNAPPLAQNSPERFAITRSLCTFLQKNLICKFCCRHFCPTWTIRPTSRRQFRFTKKN